MDRRRIAFGDAGRFDLMEHREIKICFTALLISNDFILKASTPRQIVLSGSASTRIGTS